MRLAWAVPRPPPSRRNAGGEVDTISCVGSPKRWSSFCPGGGVERDPQRDVARGERGGRALGLVGEAVGPLAATSGSGTRVSWCAGRLDHDQAGLRTVDLDAASLGSRSPVASVPTSPVTGSNRRRAPL